MADELTTVYGTNATEREVPVTAEVWLLFEA
jgi:hypothetical protein